MSQKMYTTQEIADLCGTTYREIIGYEERGYVKATGQASGSGTKRHWTADEMRWCVAISILRKVFLPEFLRDIGKVLK